MGRKLSTNKQLYRQTSCNNTMIALRFLFVIFFIITSNSLLFRWRLETIFYKFKLQCCLKRVPTFLCALFIDLIHFEPQP